MAERRDEMLAEIGRRRDDLIALTQDLIRIPTLNPPGDAYLEICEYLGKRLKAAERELEEKRKQVATRDEKVTHLKDDLETIAAGI